MSTSKMPVRIWADLNSPALSRSQDQAGGFDSAMPYYRADIVDAMAGALKRAAVDLSAASVVIEAHTGATAHGLRQTTSIVDSALTSYREASNVES